MVSRLLYFTTTDHGVIKPRYGRWCNNEKTGRTRNNIPAVEAKVHRIEGEQSLELFLQVLVEKLERGEITHEDVERIAGPFLKSVEGTPKATVEFHFSHSVRLFFSPDGVRLQPSSEIRYEKLVEKIVESGEWKRKSAEEIKEGPTFGEGR